MFKMPVQDDLEALVPAEGMVVPPPLDNRILYHSFKLSFDE